MEVYHDKSLTAEFYTGDVRSHPWTTGVNNPTHRYTDFKRSPESIETALEDFLPVREVPSVQQFYALLRHINRPEGLLESNDCACKPLRDSKGKGGFAHVSKLEGTGRLMLLFRNWRANTNDEYTQSLFGCMFRSIEEWPTDARAVISVGYSPVAFPSLHPQPWGRQVVLHWWLWGDDSESTWGALADVCAAIRSAVDYVEAAIRRQCAAGCAPDSPGAPFEEPPAERS